MQHFIELINAEIKVLDTELQQLRAIEPKGFATNNAIAVNLNMHNILVKQKNNLQNIIPSRTSKI